MRRRFYHIKNLQSTKTVALPLTLSLLFYHIKNLQSTKTTLRINLAKLSFITLRIYKVLKLDYHLVESLSVLSH